MAPKADMRSGSKSGLPDPIDGLGTDLQLEVAFLGVVLVPPRELKGRLWGMTVTVGTSVVACPRLPCVPWSPS